jgi:hypothetical protein
MFTSVESTFRGAYGSNPMRDGMSNGKEAYLMFGLGEGRTIDS